MKTAILLALMAGTACAAEGFSTVPEMRSDFAKASPCHSIDGRKVWAGDKAFYVQAYEFASGQSKALSHDSASAIVKAEQPKETIAMFKKSCQ